METSIEVRYAGVVVGRTAHAREVGPGLFIGIAEPLPVGTLVTLKIGDAVREARVAEVVEAADPSVVGMRVVFDVTAGASAPTPVAAAPAPTSEPVAAAPAPAPVASEPVAAAPPPFQPDAPSAAAQTEASEAISAPLSLAEPGGGGGKRRRKRR